MQTEVWLQSDGEGGLEPSAPGHGHLFVMVRKVGVVEASTPITAYVRKTMGSDLAIGDTVYKKVQE